MKCLNSSINLLRYSVLIFSLFIYSLIIIDILKGINLMIPIIFPSSRVVFDLLEEGEWLFDVWYEIALGNTFSFYTILIIEIIVFIGGLMLFLIGLIYSFRAKRVNKKIINCGAYKFIRHPQNVGIILTSLPCVFFLPGREDFGIQIGGIPLRILFIVCMIIYSDLQELNIQQKFPEKFKTYKENVGFFIPKIRRGEIGKISAKKKNYFLRYYVLILTWFFSILMIEVIIDLLILMEIGRFIIYL